MDPELAEAVAGILEGELTQNWTILQRIIRTDVDVRSALAERLLHQLRSTSITPTHRRRIVKNFLRSI